MPPVFEPDFDLKRPFIGIWARFPHARRKIHFYLSPRNGLLFRPQHAPADWWGSLFPPLARIWINNPKRLRRIIKTGFPNPLHEGHLFRFFVLSDPISPPKRHWAIHWHPEIGYILPQDATERSQGAYFQPHSHSTTPKNLWKSPTSEIMRHFEREWHDSTSDVRAALPWCDWSMAERRGRALRWEKGSLNELKEVLEAALKCDSVLWESGLSGEATFIFGANRLHISHYLDNREARHHLPPRQFSPRVMQLIGRLQERNVGFYDLPAGNRNDWHLPWEDIEPPHSRYRRVQYSFEVSPPSQHEIFEASLFLRDWLQNNAPDLLPDWFPN